MDKSILISIKLVKERIEDINQIIDDNNKNLIPKKNYYYDSLKLKLIEIGEECKVINDFLKENEGNWNDIISKQYNLRISLTHFYKNMADKKIDNYINNQLNIFIKEINSIESKYLNKIN